MTVHTWFLTDTFVNIKVQLATKTLGDAFFAPLAMAVKDVAKPNLFIIADAIPNLRYSAACACIFITLLLKNNGIEKAYYFATNDGIDLTHRSPSIA